MFFLFKDKNMFHHFNYAIRNFFKAYTEKSQNDMIPLGRWNWKKCDSSLNNYFANIDSCGDRVCGEMDLLQKDVRKILSKNKNKG